MSPKAVRLTATPPPEAPIRDSAGLAGLTVRELLRELAGLEDGLHALRRTAAERPSGRIPDPEQQQLLLLERAVIRELRSRTSHAEESHSGDAGGRNRT